MYSSLFGKLLFFKQIVCFLVCLCVSVTVYSQNHHERYEAIDILEYDFYLELSDSSNLILGKTDIQLKFLKPTKMFYLDLKNLNIENKGMKVVSVFENDTKLRFMHENDRIYIKTNNGKKGKTNKITINYQGVPADGLIIATNKFGNRTFFGDNWPDRASNWLPVIDHPSDKALVTFQVNAPSHYQVVSNGKLVEETNIGQKTLTVWKTKQPLATKLMVIGVAQFATEHFETKEGISISSWVYPENRTEGFYDYKIAEKSMAFFSEKLGKFPYSKLANVQSKTVYGGMENAGCIFYHESSVTGKRQSERLLAHEIAHQWFGDAVTEMNWHHIWLSEGFATYLTDLYYEEFFGKDAFKARLAKERQRVIDFSKVRKTPIIDTTVTDYLDLLNENSYQKGAWFLHILRNEIGDSIFWKSLRDFYETYKHKNALTGNFRAIVEKNTEKNHEKLFHQWLWQAGHPILKSKISRKGNKNTLTITQTQENLFEFSLDVKFELKNGSSIIKTFKMAKATESFELDFSEKVKEIVLDPNVRMLFEEK